MKFQLSRSDPIMRNWSDQNRMQREESAYRDIPKNRVAAVWKWELLAPGVKLKGG